MQDHYNEANKAQVISLIDANLNAIVPRFLSLENADRLNRHEMAELGELRSKVHQLQGHRADIIGAAEVAA